MLFNVYRVGGGLVCLFSLGLLRPEVSPQQRVLVASTTAFLPAALSFRFGLGAAGATGDGKAAGWIQPTVSSCDPDALPGGGTHCLLGCREGGGFRGSAGQHLSESTDLKVYPLLAGLEAFDGGEQNVPIKFRDGHMAWCCVPLSGQFYPVTAAVSYGPGDLLEALYFS